MNSYKQFLLITLLICSFIVPSFAQGNEETMYAHYINVGQGQSILLEFPHGAILIDAGAQPEYEIKLIDYLKKFFKRRTDLQNTLNTVFITHQHIDHNIALDDVERNFKILNYIDNGNRKKTKAEKNQIWMQDNAANFGIQYEDIRFEKITKNHNLSGLTDQKIDPINGDEIDPKLIVYSGGFAKIPLKWSAADYKNENNHSLVLKVIFGKASFLFSGDLELRGIKQVLNYYENTTVLEADIMQVGHHGAHNSITQPWLNAIKPKYALISCGKWDSGKKPNGSATMFTTYAYAHPNLKALDLLETNLQNTRTSTTQQVGKTGSSRGKPPVFITKSISCAIYATPWDGNIVVKATAEGNYEITTQN